MRKCVCLLAVMAALSTASFANMTYDVIAKDHTIQNPLVTDIYLNIGDQLTVSADEDDTWSAGSGARISNADGLHNFNEYVYDGFSFRYGSLIGQIGDGDYFFIGLNYNKAANEAGYLKLMYWDSNYGDNFDSIEAVTSYVQVSPPTAAVPAPGALILSSLGTSLVGYLRRKKN